MAIFKPQPSAWVVLLVPCVPIAAFGVVLLVKNPAGWPVPLLMIGLAAAIIGFNATLRLSISPTEIGLRRYGRTVWTVPRAGTDMRDGWASDVRKIPAHFLWHGGKPRGYILKKWFDPGTIAELRRAIEK